VDHVVIDTPRGPHRLKNDFVLALIGYHPDYDFLRSMGIELVVDAMDLARQLDEIVLFSGDGDFRALVQALKCQGVRVTVVSTMASQPPIIADELRRQADVFIDLTELQPKIRREEPGRTPRSPSAELIGHSH